MSYIRHTFEKLVCLHNITNIVKKKLKSRKKKNFKFFYVRYLFLKSFCLILHSQMKGNGGVITLVM